MLKGHIKIRNSNKQKASYVVTASTKESFGMRVNCGEHVVDIIILTSGPDKGTSSPHVQVKPGSLELKAPSPWRPPMVAALASRKFQIQG